jgi:hypothetical protein
MFGKKTYLKTLESRKRLLLAESEVNRAELIKDWGTLNDEFSRVKRQVRAASSIASSAAVLATVFSLARRRFGAPDHANGRAQPPHPKAAWLSAALDGARVGASLFLKIRSFLRERK